MAITSERIWDIDRETQRDLGDTFILGRPARIIGGESTHLLHRVDWGMIARSASVDFFDDRDPDCSVRSSLAKILAVVVAVTGISLIAVGTLAALGTWAIDAILS